MNRQYFHQSHAIMTHLSPQKSSNLRISQYFAKNQHIALYVKIPHKTQQHNQQEIRRFFLRLSKFILSLPYET